MKHIGMIAFCVAMGVATNSESQIKDDANMSSAMSSLGSYAASLQDCGIDTSDALVLIRKILVACKATDDQARRVTGAFTSSLTQHRNKDPHLACPWTSDQAQKTWQSMLDAMKAAADYNGQTADC
jgi:hypothetical protein